MAEALNAVKQLCRPCELKRVVQVLYDGQPRHLSLRPAGALVRELWSRFRHKGSAVMMIALVSADSVLCGITIGIVSIVSLSITVTITSNF